MKKIGLFGGTFNPIHRGHLQVATTAKFNLDLDEVWFIPAGIPYMKDPNEVACYDDRRNMVELAIDGYKWASIACLELPDRPSYTADTIRTIKSVDKVNEYYLILGEDAYEQLGTWKEYEYILDNVNIFVVARGGEGHKVNELYGHPSTFFYNTITYDTSSTEIRKSIKVGNMKLLKKLPSAVLEYIKVHKLYRGEGFNAEATKNQIVKWIRNKMNGFGANTNAVIGISGGKDSSVVAALCVEALGADRVYGVTMPDGAQADLEDSYRLINHLRIHHIPFNIQAITNACKLECVIGMDCEASKDAMINMPARIRMTMLYMVAQTLGHSFVVNTCNLSEDWVGYSTWHGDSAGDFSPLAKLTSEEVVAIGDACGLPHDLTHKTPSDGLCGQTDEDKLGFTYATLNKYIRTGEIDDINVKKKIDMMHEKNKFKLEPLDYFNYEG